MSILKPFQAALAWLKTAFTTVETKIAPIVLAVLEAIKGAEDGGFLDAIAAALDHVTDHLSTEINAQIKANVNKAIAVALAIEAPPATGASAADIQAWEQKVLAAIGGSSLAIKGQLWDTIGAQIYVELQALFAPGADPLTFGTIVTALEKAWVQYQVDLEQTADPVQSPAAQAGTASTVTE